MKEIQTQRISVFDMFKIGVGPSSSHTMGPWRAAQRFVESLDEHELKRIKSVRVHLYGSLAKTGKGHGTDIAVQLGLSGKDPVTIDVSKIGHEIETIADDHKLLLAGRHPVAFDCNSDIVFHSDHQLPFHSNGMRFEAQFADRTDCQATYYSVGGGFVICEDEKDDVAPIQLPFPIDSGADLLNHCQKNASSISDVVWENEIVWRDRRSVQAGLADLRDAMYASTHRGCCVDGVLLGGLGVQRRAAAMSQKLLGYQTPDQIEDWLAAITDQSNDFPHVLNWVSCFALAVNEENAAFGRIVTAPTNGAAGVIPAVMLYCRCFCDVPADFHERFLLTAGEIGSIFKKGATISAAMGGCQAEIGVSSAMAAAALTESLGGTAGQAAEAAEIAMEHHLGMTCDPIGGLVQVPCIERNAMGAIKAITAAQMALQRDPKNARVSLDDVVATMWRTAQDMNAKYKETSEGGLAIQVPVNVSEC